MTIRKVTPADGSSSVTVPAPGDPYATPTTFTIGQVLDVTPGGAWVAGIGTANLTTLGGEPLADDQQGDDAADNS